MNWHPQHIRILALVIVLVLVILFFGSQIDNYYSARLFNRVSTSVAIIAVIAVGQVLVVLTRNIDLSVGSIVGLSAYIVGNMLAQNNDIHPVIAILAAIAVGGACGMINGVLVAYGGVPAIIVTLGTLALFRTFLVEYSDAGSVTTVMLPEWLLDLPRTDIFTIEKFDFRLMVGVALAVVVIFHLMLSRLRFGRQLYAIGSSPEAAVMAGIPSKRVVFLAFVLCGALSGLAGFMFLAKFGNITVVAGLGLELKSVAAVVVGGVNIFGGSGTVLGVMLGAVLVDLIDNSLIRWAAISEFWRDALLGMLILLAVATDTVLMKRLGWLRRKKKQTHAGQQRSETTASTAGVPHGD
jgi:rhamnose transport system permease protein